jgi:hypothetical protein
MRQGAPNNGRRPRGRHHGGGGHGSHHSGSSSNGGGHDRGNSTSTSGGNPALRDNRPRSASALRHQTFDSNCIDLRVRGNAWQVFEKYQALARDAQSGGDRVAAENYLQHAEHYYRIIEAINEATAAEQRARGITPANPNGQPNFSQQPEVPNNYYGTDSSSHQQQPPGAPMSGDASGGGNANTHSSGMNPAEQPMAQAEVQQRNPPQVQNPFFNEEAEDEGGPEPLVANR